MQKVENYDVRVWVVVRVTVQGQGHDHDQYYGPGGSSILCRESFGLELGLGLRLGWVQGQHLWCTQKAYVMDQKGSLRCSLKTL